MYVCWAFYNQWLDVKHDEKLTRSEKCISAQRKAEKLQKKQSSF
jgi:hypothetical protein